MNRKQLAKYIAFGTDIKTESAEGAVDIMIQAITRELTDGGEVRLLGFGTFSVKTRPAGQGRNPATGEVLHIPEMRQARFKMGKSMKEALNSRVVPMRERA